MTDRRPWRVRVRRAGGGVAGAGILIDERHMLTCAHVVDQALGRDSQEQQLPPASEVQVDFVESQAGPLGARVVEGGWVPVAPDGGGDVAVLELAAQAPTGVQPAVLRRPPRLGGHRFDTYGYPRRYDTGLGATGRLASWGGPANQWMELQGVEAGHRVEGGFSGAAVYDHDAQAVVGIVVAEDRLAEAKLAWMLPVQTLLQLLGSSWPRIVDLVRAGGMYGLGEQAGHWSPKARGVEREAKGGWYFTGRTQVLGELATWLAVGQADGRVRVVTGGPGSGKSAVLARLVTLSDPLYRERVPKLDLSDPTVPPAGSIEVAVWARNKTLEEVVSAIAQATEVDASAPDGLINGLLERGRPCTIVIDALDEAVEPAGIAGNLVRPLAVDAASAGVRVLVGTRPGREDEFVTALGRDALRLDLDQPPYLERKDLVEFVARRLLLADDPAAPTPYRDQPALAGRVAVAVADRAYPTFLVAQLTSKALVQAGSVVDVESPGWELSFPGSVADAMDGYLDRLAQDAPSRQERRARKRRLRELLTPLAYAEGGGLPRTLWPAAASAMAERSYGPEELDWLLDTAADYLIEQATSDGGPIYRLYHQALAEYLRPVTLEDASARERRLATALLGQVPSRPGGSGRDWSAAHAYLTRHLATHAAAAGLLDELLDDPGFLLTADPVRLLRALPAARTPAGRQAAGVYQLAVHHLRDRLVEEAASHLELVARQQRADPLADRIGRLGFTRPWSVLWTAWHPTTPHRLVGRHTFGVLTVAVGELDGRPVVISGGRDALVRAWDLRAGPPVGKPLTVDPVGITAVAVGAVSGRTVVASGADKGKVRVWDLGTGEPIGEPLVGHTGWVYAVAVGELDGRAVVVSGGDDDTVRVWDLSTGRAVGEPAAMHTGYVRWLTIGTMDSRPVVVSSGDDGTVWVWDLRTGMPVGELLAGHTRTVTAVAVGELDGRPVVVSGDLDGIVRVWDLRTGAPVGEPLAGHTGGLGGVTAMAVGELDGRPVAVSGGDPDDRTVRVWDLSAGGPIGEPLVGHTDRVDATAVGAVDGRPVVIRGDLDGFVRLWDLSAGGPIGEPMAVHTNRVNVVAVGELDGQPVAVSGGNDGTVGVWDLQIGGPLGEPLAGHSGGVAAVAVGAMDGRPVAVSGGFDGIVRVSDLRTGASIGEPLALHDDRVREMAVGTVNDRLLIVSGDLKGIVRVWDLPVWDLRAGRPVGKPLVGHTRPIDALTVGAVDGRPVVISGDMDGTGRVWDVWTGRQLGEPLAGHAFGVGAVAVGELDGWPVVVSGDRGGIVRVWDLRAGRQPGKPLAMDSDWVRAVAVGAMDGRPVVVSGGDDGKVQVWDLGARRTHVIETGASINALVIAPSSQVLVATARGLVLLQLRAVDHDSNDGG